MSKNIPVPTPAECRRIVRERRQALCLSARVQYESDALVRWLINSLWVVATVDQSNGRVPFRPAGQG